MKVFENLRPWHVRSSVLLAGLFTVISSSYAALSGDTGSRAVAMIRTGLFFAAYTAFLIFIFRISDYLSLKAGPVPVKRVPGKTPGSPDSPDGTDPGRINVNTDLFGLKEKKPLSGFFFSFFTILFFWGVYYLMCFPGNIEWDTGTMILYSLGVNRTNTNNPYFQTALFGSVYRLGKLMGDPKIGIGIYCFVQFISCIAVLSCLLYRIGEKSGKARLILTLLYSLVPAFPVYAMTMGKDSNFSIVILACTALFIEMVTDPDLFFGHKKKTVLLGTVILLIGLMRNMAVFVPVTAVILFAVSVYRKKETEGLTVLPDGKAVKPHLRRSRGQNCLTPLMPHRPASGVIRFAAILCAASIFVCILFPRLLGIPGSNLREALSVPIQQTGYYMKEYADEVTKGEYKKITGIVPYKYIEKYDPSISDPIKTGFKRKPTSKQLINYFRAWLSQFRKHPLAYGRAWYLLTYGYYTPYADLSNVKRHTFIGFKVKTEVYDNSELTPNTNEYLRLARKLDLISLRVPVYNVFTKIGIYTWILLVGIAILIQKKQYAWFICFSPAVMVIAGCLFSPVNGYYRYALPMILCAPVLFVNALFLEKKPEPAGTKKRSREPASGRGIRALSHKDPESRPEDKRGRK